MERVLEDTKVSEMARVKNDRLYGLFTQWVDAKNREFTVLQRQVA